MKADFSISTVRFDTTGVIIGYSDVLRTGLALSATWLVGAIGSLTGLLDVTDSVLSIALNDPVLMRSLAAFWSFDLGTMLAAGLNCSLDDAASTADFGVSAIGAVSS